MTVGDIWHFLRRWAMVIWMIVFVITVIFFVTTERADDRAEDRHFQEQDTHLLEQDIAVCEGGNRLAESMRAQWRTLANVVLEGETNPTEIERVQEILQQQLDLVPVFDCDSLPRP